MGHGITEDHYDVIIAGAGPAGSSAAIELASHGFSVALLEQKIFPRPKLCGEFISPECLVHFKEMGVLDQMLARGGVPLRETVFYSHTGRSISVPSSWFVSGSVALGLSRAEMDDILLQRARVAGAQIQEETTAVSLIERNGRIIGVHAKRNRDELTFLAPIVLDATGRARGLARNVEQRGKGSRSKARLIAFKAHMENTSGTNGACEIYSYRGGYGGLNSVENGLSNLCFIIRSADVRRLGNDPETAMRRVLMQNPRASSTLSGARAVSKWLSVSIEGFGRRSPTPFPGLFAVGDAASFIDPFTGSGMLMALESGRLLGKLIANELPATASAESVTRMAAIYARQYSAKFDSRLRFCSLLRFAAFLPHLSNLVIAASSVSDKTRRFLAVSTRGAPSSGNSG